MEIIFLGHQSWLLGSNKTYIIVDPILTETFGTSSELKFRVYPPRQIEIDSIPSLSGIFITNEHLDHFHLPSLKLLDKNIPVFMGKAMPNCVKDTIKGLGFELFEMNNAESVQLNSLKIGCYLGKNTVPFWERRCYQLFITDEYENGVFVQSDTLVSDLFISQVEKKIEPSPMVFITTNNSQVLPFLSHGAFDNLLPLASSNKEGVVGINFLDEILLRYPQKLPNVSTILFSGSGYIIDKTDSLPFLFSNPKELNNCLEKLTLVGQAKMLYPGEKIHFDPSGTCKQSTVDWIKLDVNLYHEIQTRATNLLTETLPSAVFSKIFSHNDLSYCYELLTNELETMAKHILLSSLGKSLLTINDYMNGPLDAHRLVINFKITTDKSIICKLNVNTASFSIQESKPSDLYLNFPFGVELFLSDFIALLEGKIQIWELATANIHQWYFGDKLNSPIGFLYSYFSEQIRPELALKVYEQLNAQ